ncbi:MULTISPECIES: ribosome biogenesis GTPase YlqF [Clostridium]|uniref:Ribosome biogenesis GTPase A n=2 Tax=Clostridium TaxID=1485 RepID=B2TJ33_CLOBB|nr:MULTISPECIES: ribosome biogenesis GTPase YlqF [Clostridium]ACD23880.1 GTP-binding protein [Clostridium botulinum B str. Eklund 17B (NRP)]MBN1051603.1 ribosome biogenesis GTPase YlqF [Clostridium botulinum]MBN1054831.1 ribosome biogenesis GTPase YlqF [Clostridium botulinum]MBY6974927.1 ribosome biogenesis GTPase YlqF [Clostridium botulinum]MBY6999907.1 ribosome biogenesis GTPase YlqF [Clostridium botulinum]
MAINWFPGHMKKTQREIKENLKLVDAVIEIRDARIPRSSANPDIDSLLQGKPRIILLNKSDLTEGKVTKEWIKHLTKDDVKVLEVNCLKGDGLKAIKPMLLSLLKEKHDRLRAKGMVNITTRVMVVGIPNVGKSTFINKMARNSIAKTGDKPGVTKSKQWIKTSIGIELLDTPGVLWPRFEDEETALNLAFTGAIKDEIMDIEELSYKLVERLQSFYKDNLKERYKIDEVSEDPLETLNAIAKKRGTLVSGGEINYNRIAVILLDEFRAGRIGKISLERPGKINE